MVQEHLFEQLKQQNADVIAQEQSVIDRAAERYKVANEDLANLENQKADAIATATSAMETAKQLEEQIKAKKAALDIADPAVEKAKSVIAFAKKLEAWLEQGVQLFSGLNELRNTPAVDVTATVENQHFVGSTTL